MSFNSHFPNFELKNETAEMLTKVGYQWGTPSDFRPPVVSIPFNATDDPFTVNWPWTKINEEPIQVKRETDLSRIDTTLLLFKPQEKSNCVQREKGSALRSIVGVPLCDPGVLLTGIRGSCGLLGYLDNEKPNQEEMQKKLSG